MIIGEAVYKMDLNKQTGASFGFTKLEAPADIGYDPGRHHLLIPLVTQNRPEFRRIP